MKILRGKNTEKMPFSKTKCCIHMKRKTCSVSSCFFKFISTKCDYIKTQTLTHSLAHSWCFACQWNVWKRNQWNGEKLKWAVEWSHTDLIVIIYTKCRQMQENNNAHNWNSFDGIDRVPLPYSFFFFFFVSQVK